MSSNVPKLKTMAEATDTDYWNDSCSIQELNYAIPNGAVGATSNPQIVTAVLKKEMHHWKDRIVDIAAHNHEFDEDQIAWRLIEEMAVKGAELLKPVFDREKGLKGRISIQTNAKYYRNTNAMADQAEKFSKLAPNMQVKIPVTDAGIHAIEESTCRGVSVNATVCFSVSQALAVADAVERGIARREKEGKGSLSITPVCTIMIGRVDDWLKIVANKNNILVNPAYLDMAGVAVMKNALRIYKKRGYRTRLLCAAYRNRNHVAELIGGNLIHTIPYAWQLRFNDSDIEVKNTAELELDPMIIDVLKENFPDFVKAYEPEGMNPEDFLSYGATTRTLRGFISGYEELLSIVRNLILPNPDL